MNKEHLHEHISHRRPSQVDDELRSNFYLILYRDNAISDQLKIK